MDRTVSFCGLDPPGWFPFEPIVAPILRMGVERVDIEDDTRFRRDHDVLIANLQESCPVLSTLNDADQWVVEP